MVAAGVTAGSCLGDPEKAQIVHPHALAGAHQRGGRRLFDDDGAGQNYCDKVKKHLDGAALDQRVALPYVSPELFLCEHGFGHLYEKRMSRQKSQPTSPPGTPDYWREVLRARGKYSKPEVAAEAVEEMIADPQRVPEELVRIVERAISLAQTR